MPTLAPMTPQPEPFDQHPRLAELVSALHFRRDPLFLAGLLYEQPGGAAGRPAAPGDRRGQPRRRPAGLRQRVAGWTRAAAASTRSASRCCATGSCPNGHRWPSPTPKSSAWSPWRSPTPGEELTISVGLPNRTSLGGGGIPEVKGRIAR
jgi:hypothetical protein